MISLMQIVLLCCTKIFCQEVEVSNKVSVDVKNDMRSYAIIPKICKTQGGFSRKTRFVLLERFNQYFPILLHNK